MRFVLATGNRHKATELGAILARLCPGVSVTLSSEVCPEAREYERTSTAIANAYVQPLMAGYLGRLQEALAAEAGGAPPAVAAAVGTLARTSCSVMTRGGPEVMNVALS